jgi:sodium transport system permease protein
MRLQMIQAIYQKELLDLVRDRRTLISMVVVPVVVLPLIFNLATRFAGRMEQNAEQEAKTMGIAVRVSTPSIREALEKTGLQLSTKDDLKAAVESKTSAAAVEELPGTPPQIEIYVDSSNPTSSTAAEKIRMALTDLRDQRIRESLRNSGLPVAVLTPFTIKRNNIASQRQMSGGIWGMIIPYLLLLIMFTTGMYPVIDMTAGEKERKTLEAFLSSPASRQEIVMGKIVAAMTAIFVTAGLTLASLVYSISRNRIASGKSDEAREVMNAMSAIPLDAHTVTLIAMIVLPMAVFAASVMFTIALFARSFKEGQSYLTPLAFIVIIPAFLGGMPGLHLTPVMCLIPIFNASMMIRGVLLGDASTLNLTVTLAANLVYAAIAFVIATRMFNRESVLFRT